MNANSPNIKPSGALPGIVWLDCILLHLQSAFCYQQIGWHIFKFSFRKIWECWVWDILGFSLAFFLVLTNCYGSQRAAWGRAWSPLKLNSESLLFGWCSPQQVQLRGRVSLVRCGKCQCIAPTSVLILCPCPLLDLFSEETREKEMPAFLSPERHKPFCGILWCKETAWGTWGELGLMELGFGLGTRINLNRPLDGEGKRSCSSNTNRKVLPPQTIALLHLLTQSMGEQGEPPLPVIPSCSSLCNP